uniref:Thioredoxin n=1 Tax=Caldicellulosiruptor owensensis TaxID=55205 RepID=A0A7C5V5E8_9FIRM
MANNIVTLTSENFEKEVLQSDIPVVVDFWAAWCGPCRMVAPVIEELAQEYAGKVKFAKLNVDDYSDIAYAFRIMSIPTIMLFKDGKAVDKIIGARPKSDFVNFINRNL